MEILHGKVSLWLHALIWVIGAIIVTPIIYWVLDDAPPIHFAGGEHTNVTAAKPGFPVETTYYADVLRNSKTCLPEVKCDLPECSLDAERAWTDANGQGIPSTTMHLSYSKGRNPISITMVIPSNAYPGAANITNAILWACNPIQRLFPRRMAMPPLTVIVDRE